MIALLAVVPLCRRWMTILPLGGETARAVGMALTPARVALLLLAACLTATATMTIGPLSFVGLMAPHIARMMGFRRTMPHIVMSALTGGVMLVFADWCGRMVLFPVSDPCGSAVDLYRCAVLYLSVEKAEPVVRCGLMPSPRPSPTGEGEHRRPGKRERHPAMPLQLRKHLTCRVDGVVDIFFTVRHGHKARFER